MKLSLKSKHLVRMCKFSQPAVTPEYKKVGGGGENSSIFSQTRQGPAEPCREEANGKGQKAKQTTRNPPRPCWCALSRLRSWGLPCFSPTSESLERIPGCERG